MSSFQTRLKELRLEEHLTQAELASIIGISKSTISMYENGNREPDFEILEAFADYFNVDMNYLTGYADDPVDYDKYDGYLPEQFNGDVKRFFEFQKAVDRDVMEEQQEFDTFLKTISPSEKDGIQKYRSLDPHGKEMVDFTLLKEWERSTSTHEKEPKSVIPDTDPMRLINYYYRLASAGTGQIIFDMPPTKRIEIPDLPEYRKADYAIGVNGNSMEPTYYDGDTLLVEMTEQIEVGEIGIFLVNNECYVKKLGQGELISLNPECSNIPLNETARCMGRVIDKLGR